MLSIILFGIILATGISGQTCPKGFESNAGSCYFFSHGKESWIGAFDSCKIFNSMLVEINSAVENDYLVNKTSELGSTNNWWMGLTDKQVEGEYVWETSQQIIAAGEYTNWGSGEPSSHNNENCIKLSHTKHFMWSDTGCDNTEHYICETTEGSVDIIG